VHEKAFLAEGDVELAGAEAGVKYLAASGNAVALVHRSREGDYLNRVVNPATFFDNAFREDETELRANWAPSGKSSLRGRLGWLKRKHDHIPQRDFSGAAGELDYVWTPTGKLRLEFGARRALAAWWEAAASYRVNDTLSFTPTWQAGAKTAVRLRLEHTTSDYRGAVVPLAAAARSDRLRSAQLALDWAPAIRVNCVCPGVIETPMTAELRADAAWRETALRRYPLGRFGRPEEIAAAILYLSSDEAAWVTGVALPVDGGYTAA